MHSTTSPFLTVVEVADHLSISERHARQLIADGHLRAARMGRAVRVHRDDLAAYVERIRA